MVEEIGLVLFWFGLEVRLGLGLMLGLDYERLYGFVEVGVLLVESFEDELVESVATIDED